MHKSNTRKYPNQNENQGYFTPEQLRKALLRTHMTPMRLTSRIMVNWWVCHISLKVHVVNKDEKGKQGDFLLWIVNDNIIHCRMISTKILDNLVLVLDGSNAGVVLLTKHLLHESFVMDQSQKTNPCFKTLPPSLTATV